MRTANRLSPRKCGIILVFLIGDDYESSNKEYVSINTDKEKLISIALAASGIPFKGRFSVSHIKTGAGEVPASGFGLCDEKFRCSS